MAEESYLLHGSQKEEEEEKEEREEQRSIPTHLAASSRYALLPKVILIHQNSPAI